MSSQKDGLIQVRIQKEGNVTNHKLSMGWSLSITVPSGGIIEAKDLYLYKAPLEGYLKKWEKELKRINKGDYIEGFMGRTHKFYIMLNDGEYYGRLYIDIDPFFQDYSLLRLEYFVNKEGERNLNYPLRVTNTDYQGIKSYFNYR